MNYKVRCTGYKQTTEKYFTIGKVYDVINGEITNDHGYTYKSVNAIEWLSKWYSFVRVGDAQKLIVTVNGAETLARLYEGNKVIKSATAKCSPDDTFDFEKGAKLAVERLFTTTEQKAIKIEVGKSYWLKPYDEVENHWGIGKHCWNSIEKAPVKITKKKSRDAYNGETCFLGEWHFLPEHFASEAPQYYNGKVVCVSVSGGYFAYTVGKIYEFIDGRVKIDNGSIIPSNRNDAVTSLEDWNGRDYTRAKFIPLVEGE